MSLTNLFDQHTKYVHFEKWKEANFRDLIFDVRFFENLEFREIDWHAKRLRVGLRITVALVYF